MNSGGISHNQKAFRAKFLFNFKVKFSLVSKRISVPWKIQLAGKWSLLSMCSLNKNLPVINVMKALSTQFLCGWSLRESPLSTNEHYAVQISLVLS